MKTAIAADINYSRSILDKVFRCKCGHPLLMFGCDNPDCDNFWRKRIKKESNNDKDSN